MAAGLGFKTFNTGDVLTAADTNGYLMQGVLVFASAAARDAAITSPQEGQFAYLKDTNVTTYYTGSAWTNLDTTGMVNPMTTTGDTIYSSSGSTPARLGIGSTGQVLTVAGGVPSWATASSGGGMTLLATITASAATSMSFTSISQSYKHLFMTWEGVFSSVNDTAYWGVRLNNDSGANYSYYGTTTTTNSVIGGVDFGNSATTAPILGGANIVDPPYSNYGSMWIRDYTNTTLGTGLNWVAMATTNGTVPRQSVHNAVYHDTAAISRIDFIRNSTQTVTGTIRLYGVS